jgi:phosphatidylserine/phosphatidylglycerophosphate/cardiolipin synthase-like enzyme
MIPHELLALGELSLRALAASLTDGVMKRGVVDSIVQSIVGSSTSMVLDALRNLEARGFTPPQIGLLLQTVAAERERHVRPDTLIELVLSGPQTASVPMQDTAAVLQTLVRTAQHEILLVGYAVQNGREIFRDLAERLDFEPSLSVTLCLNVHREGDTSASAVVVRRFADTFRARHWPGKRLPQLYYFPPSLELEPSTRAALHAKCVVVDRAQALVTSANFTEAAQSRNIELGLLVRHAPMAARIHDYFDALIATAALRPLSSSSL